MEKTINFLKGMSMVFDIRPSAGYTINHHSDTENLASDWRKVGQDMKSALRKIDDERERNQRRAS